MKILLAVDGSSYTRAAARYLARHRGAFAQPQEIFLLHAHPAIPYPGAAKLAGKDAVESYQRETSLEALAVAEEELERAKLDYTSSWRVGEAAQVINEYVRAKGIDLVICGSHGHGALANLALGSIATKLLATLPVPLLVVTREAALEADREQGNGRGDGAREGDAIAGDR